MAAGGDAAGDLDEFDLLEKRIGEVAAQYAMLKVEHARLKDQVREREAELVSLKERVARLTNERGAVRARVDQLIRKLEGMDLR